jgi:hypothetical protein
MLGFATTSTKTLKLIVKKNHTSLVTSLTPKTIKPTVFSILPKNTKKEEKNSKKNRILTLPPLITLITKSNKVFSILPNNKEKNIHKPKNKIHNKLTQKRTKTPPKTNIINQSYKTHTTTQNKNKTKTIEKRIIKTTTTKKKTHHHFKNKPKNKKTTDIWKNIRKSRNIRKRRKRNKKRNIKQSLAILNNKRYTLKATFHDKKLILSCGDIESNPGPKFTLLLNHPQEHLEKYKTYFYKNTTQIKNEYIHILEVFKPYLNHTYRENTNPQLKQFCINNQQCSDHHLFFAILITLAPTPTQCNQLISKNLTRWTLILLNKIINNITPLPTEPHPLQKFHLENPNITKPLDSIQKEIYTFITTERPNIDSLLQKFPYLLEKLALETLKCLHPLPNFTNPNLTQTYPIL